ncbi:polyprenyl synthetase family protein [Streptomyces sp. LX-29]|uniref:polyprenyl synthetase family protein n=1 Tax=Streptomyces sp. LX-29 TaxID=2900152 RepID=UPI00240E539C|nr:polyprenyl synthetase family protein [Streptomyces sp. LX-29]WFB11428.1 polyprenyl synthetase family protein [Streptomyces sp. LX-29]
MWTGCARRPERATPPTGADPTGGDSSGAAPTGADPVPLTAPSDITAPSVVAPSGATEPTAREEDIGERAAWWSSGGAADGWERDIDALYPAAPGAELTSELLAASGLAKAAFTEAAFTEAELPEGGPPEDAAVGGTYDPEPRPGGRGTDTAPGADGSAGDPEPDVSPNGSLDRRIHAALVAPVRHLLDSGGRRWRPRLMTAVIEALGGDGVRFGTLLAACELLHTGSLMIDDIQDRAPLRRGRRTAHTVYGTAATITAGTAAYFCLDRAIRRTLPPDPRLRTAVYEIYLTALRAAHAGQALDLQGHHEEMDLAVERGDVRPLLRMLALTHRLKSGAPVRALFETAAVVGGATAGQRAALGALGEAVGMAYQITDDVADLRGVANEEGETKRVAEDLHNAKVTFPLAYAVTRLPGPEAAALWERLRGGPDARAVRRIARTIEACGALDRCEQRAAGLVEEAWAAVAEELPATAAARRLRHLADATVRRPRAG